MYHVTQSCRSWVLTSEDSKATPRRDACTWLFTAALGIDQQRDVVSTHSTVFLGHEGEWSYPIVSHKGNGYKQEIITLNELNMPRKDKYHSFLICKILAFYGDMWNHICTDDVKVETRLSRGSGAKRRMSGRRERLRMGWISSQSILYLHECDLMQPSVIKFKSLFFKWLPAVVCGEASGLRSLRDRASLILLTVAWIIDPVQLSTVW